MTDNVGPKVDESPVRLLVLTTHAIQHFVPQYASLGSLPEVSLKVIFATDKGIKPEFDSAFARSIAWEGLALDQFQWAVVSQVPGSSRRHRRRSIVSEIESFNPDAVVVYGYRSEISRVGTNWAAAQGVPLVYCSDSERRRERHALKEALTRTIKRRLLRRIDWAMTVGDANEEFYRYCSVPEAKFLRTGFPIDRERYEEAFQRRDEIRGEVRRRLGFKSDDFVMFNVGKLIPHKRQTDLLAATETLNESEDRRYVALLAGSGPDEGRVSDVVSSMRPHTAIALGFVPHTELPNYYLAADLYVHTASFEPHSLAITEATYLGLPIVLSNRCGSWGPTDDVRPGRNGSVFSCGSVSALADAVSSLGRNPTQLHDWGAESRRIALEGQRRAHRDAWKLLVSRVKMAKHE